MSRKARWLRYAVLATMSFVVLANALLAWRGLTHHPDTLSAVQLDATAQLGSHPRLALIDTALLSLIYLYGLYRLVRLMHLFERGEFFSATATGHLRAFAFTLLLGTVAGCLLPPIELAVSRWMGLNHLASVSISMDGSDIWMILISTLFFVIAWIMAEARQLAEDNQLIV
ncbi:DUF2975 domain-containing protein [Dyella mobilis]|uniref:DUF2975 domain-containing protein n=1 Tax=Dyella mobilis TaxID=1849582 RepID=A0ABS2KA60_9GAMM|nr:DUF2975 domain-containing protein [Dyella mobilis]MBM7128051.1 DUF2975 domain-containing protein [Dyella mobilis]